MGDVRVNAQGSSSNRGVVIIVIAITILLMFIGIWAWILWRAVEDPSASIPNQFVVAAGTLSTLLASLTSAAIGAAIAEVKVGSELTAGDVAPPADTGPEALKEYRKRLADSRRSVNVVTVVQALSWRTKTAILTYVVVGLAVLAVWLVLDAASPEIVASFALSIVGWLIGAAGVVFEGSPVPGDTERQASSTASAPSSPNTNAAGG